MNSPPYGRAAGRGWRCPDPAAEPVVDRVVVNRRAVGEWARLGVNDGPRVRFGYPIREAL